MCISGIHQFGHLLLLWLAEPWLMAQSLHPWGQEYIFKGKVQLQLLRALGTVMVCRYGWSIEVLGELGGGSLVSQSRGLFQRNGGVVFR